MQQQPFTTPFFDSKLLYGLDFASFHTPADIAAPSIDCFENDLDQLDLLELEVTQFNNAFSQIPATVGPPSSITLSSESSAHDTLSFYSEPFHSPQTSYSFEMDFNRICVDDAYPIPQDDPNSFGPLPPTPPRSPPTKPYARSSFSDYVPAKRISDDFYSQLGLTPTISPAHISTSVVPSNVGIPSPPQDKAADPRKKYKCQNCPRAFARAYNLKTHMATHDPNRLKPHVCPHPSCGRSFSRKHDLGRHLVSIHRDDADAVSTHSNSTRVSIGVGKGPRGWCETCGKGFVGKSSPCACHDVK
ncbi:hypothetical protein H0H92_005040 [Tricholoma furcatifolium]|nr:hypothetical protein H0H92_005040 [Tricholoma furcatifolium]